jgi:hypothetical protein
MTDEVHQPRNITISVHGNEICERLKETGYFEDLQDAYRTAIFVAIAQELPDNLDEDPTMRPVQNKWDTDAVFRMKGNSIEAALLALGVTPEEVIVRGKRLAEIGLRFLLSKLERNVDILDVIIPSFNLDMDVTT